MFEEIYFMFIIYRYITADACTKYKFSYFNGTYTARIGIATLTKSIVILLYNSKLFLKFKNGLFDNFRTYIIQDTA